MDRALFLCLNSYEHNVTPAWGQRVTSQYYGLHMLTDRWVSYHTLTTVTNTSSCSGVMLHIPIDI